MRTAYSWPHWKKKLTLSSTLENISPQGPFYSRHSLRDCASATITRADGLGRTSSITLSRVSVDAPRMTNVMVHTFLAILEFGWTCLFSVRGGYLILPSNDMLMDRFAIIWALWIAQLRHCIASFLSFRGFLSARELFLCCLYIWFSSSFRVGSTRDGPDSWFGAAFIPFEAYGFSVTR